MRTPRPDACYHSYTQLTNICRPVGLRDPVSPQWSSSPLPHIFGTNFLVSPNAVQQTSDGPSDIPIPTWSARLHRQLIGTSLLLHGQEHACLQWCSSPLPHILGTNFLVSPKMVPQTSDGPSDIPIPAWCERSHRSLIGICHLCSGQERACFGWCPFVCPHIYGANSLAEYCSWASPCTLAFCTVMGASCSSLNTVRIALGNREIN